MQTIRSFVGMASIRQPYFSLPRTAFCLEPYLGAIS